MSSIEHVKERAYIAALRQRLAHAESGPVVPNSVPVALEELRVLLGLEARLGRAAAQLQKLYDLAGIAHHRILSSEQGLDEESKRLGNALAATRDLLASWEGEPPQ